MRKKELIVIAIILVFTIISIKIYAKDTENSKIKDTNLIKNDLITAVNDNESTEVGKEEALEISKQYKAIISEDNLVLKNSVEDEKVILKKEYVTQKEVEFWEISDSISKIKINANNGKLISLMNKKETYTESTYSEEQVKEIAKNLYKKLNMNLKYELYYIEMFDDELWTAYFAENIDGLYNDFKSVRVTFAPADEEVVYIVNKDENCDNNEVKISKDDAESIARNKFDIDETLTCKIELKFIRENDFFNARNYTEYKKSDIIRKAWIVTINQKYIVYVDCANGNVIGGDCIE